MKENPGYIKYFSVKKLKFLYYTGLNLNQRKILSILILLGLGVLFLFYISWDRQHITRVYKHMPMKHEDVHVRNLDRHYHTRSVCNDPEVVSHDKLKQIIKTSNHIKIDKAHKLLYCFIDNPESVSWKQVMTLILMQKHIKKISKDDLAMHFETLDDFDFNIGMKANFHEVMTTYQRFLIGRNPFERLLAIYRENLEEATETNQKFRLKHGVQIIKKYRPNAPSIARRRGTTVRFEEFLQYVADFKFEGQEAIFEPIFNMCHPCLFNYTIIGNHETLSDDSGYALKNLGIHDMMFPIVHDPYHTEDLMRKYYSKIPVSLIRKIQEKYAKDFEVFKYDRNNLPGVKLY